MPATFTKTSPPIAFDKAMGLCFGWFAFSKKDGAPYIDAHGDHFPDDELVAAADALMAKPASEREINVEHAGAARGTIATVQALTEDVAKALRIDTGGTYGLVGSFRPDAELLKSILDGEAFCLSIEGSAADVETIAKSLDGATAEHKRTMRKVSLTKLAVVKAGAHEGAAVALVKSAKAALAVRRIAKREPALTSATDGHQHLIDDTDCDSGFTSYECTPGGYGHSHPWVKADDTITIGAANGHSHTVTPDTEDTMPDPAVPPVAAAAPAADLAAIKAQCDASMAAAADAHAKCTELGKLIDAAIGLPAEQMAMAKSLRGQALRDFLAAPEAVRVAKSAPIYKGADGSIYLPGEERLAAFAKRADEADAREQAVGFEKAASTTIPNLKGTLPQKAALMKSIAGLPEAERQAQVEILKSADAAMAMLFKSQGIGGNGVEPAGALAAYDAGLAEFAKSVGKPADLVADDFLSTPRGSELYAAYEAETSANRRRA